MHLIFQQFVDLLEEARDPAGFYRTLVATATALDLSSFAYIAMPNELDATPRLISTYPEKWTSRYLRSQYQRLDPVVLEAHGTAEPFRWGAGSPLRSLSLAQQQILDEASHFGIRFGFTVPVHDGRGPLAALTFACDQRNAAFDNCISSQVRVLQLIAIHFHAHARRKLASKRKADMLLLSPRERQCLEWATEGKSAWEIGCILGISRHTAASYLESAKGKLGVRTIVQAAARLAAEKP